MSIMNLLKQNGPLRYMTCGSVTLYYACVVDLRHRRTVHCVEHYPCLPDPQRVSGTEECGAVHYGYCVPVMLNADDGGVGCRTVKLDPVTRLLASPELDSNLKSLVNRFVAQDRASNSSHSRSNGATSPSGGGHEMAKKTKTAGTKSENRTGDRKSKDVVVVNGRGTRPSSNWEQTTKHSDISKEEANAFEREAEETLGKLLLDLKVAVSGNVTKKSGGEVSGVVATTSTPGNGVTRGSGHRSSPKKKKNKDIEDVELDLKDSLGGGGTARRTEDYMQSPVDYAKKRFQLNQSSVTTRSDSPVRSPLNGIPHHVSETKNRFENGLFHPPEGKWKTEWLPTPSPVDVTSNTPAASYLSYPECSPRSSPRKSPSPEPGIAGSCSLLPHPKLTSTQKQHIRERALAPTYVANTSGGTTSVPVVSAVSAAETGSVNATPWLSSSASFPIRPFLTKGSVAERVLIFERCPIHDKGSNRIHQTYYPTKPLFNTWRSSTSTSGANALDHNVIQAKVKDGRSKCSDSSKRTSRRPGSLSLQLHIPRFYYPQGRPQSSVEIDGQIQRIAAAFTQLDGQKATRSNFGVITKACQLPLYWKLPLFFACGGETKGYVTCDNFLEYWRRLLSTSHDDMTKFVRILTKGTRPYLLPEDFVSLIQDVIDTHPGLTFLKEATEFHSRYVHTVIARIYYCVNRSWSGQITAPELRKSNFIQVLSILEDEDDINQVTEYFSYEHFYVIYCKFWELDKDHDLFIDKLDLSRHNENAISSRMIERLFSGAVTRGRTQEEGKMGYSEFVWFLLSEEDKRHPTSIEYWFRCMDLNGDGFLSMYELEYFYDEQLQRMETLGIETLPFQDCLCQMLDMVQPKIPGQISLSDLKKCKMTPIFFDTFFNLEKYLDHEQRDPFASHRDQDADGIEDSDWNRYAAEEYELLVAEEGATDQRDELLYDDYEQEEDELTANLERLAFDGSGGGGDEGRPILINRSKGGAGSALIGSDDDYTDYAESDDYQY